MAYWTPLVTKKINSLSGNVDITEPSFGWVRTQAADPPPSFLREGMSESREQTDLNCSKQLSVDLTVDHKVEQGL